VNNHEEVSKLLVRVIEQRDIATVAVMKLREVHPKTVDQVLLDLNIDINDMGSVGDMLVDMHSFIEIDPALSDSTRRGDEAFRLAFEND
jgi:hypothetical protein